MHSPPCPLRLLLFLVLPAVPWLRPEARAQVVAVEVRWRALLVMLAVRFLHMPDVRAAGGAADTGTGITARWSPAAGLRDRRSRCCECS